MPKKAANPFPGDYEPEPDTTQTLNPELSSWYASLIRMLRWMVEIGRVDIITEVSKMASQMASPREGHLDALLHIFGFLRINHNSRMAYDPSYPTIDMDAFKPNDWKSFYGNVEESIPSNAPEPRGKDVDLRLYVDSDHAGEKHTHRSCMGFFFSASRAVAAMLVRWPFPGEPFLERRPDRGGSGSKCEGSFAHFRFICSFGSWTQPRRCRHQGGRGVRLQ